MRNNKLVFSLAVIMYGWFISLTVASYSGMTKIDDTAYLVVHDLKSNNKGNRLGLLSIHEDQPPVYSPIIIKEWNHPDGRASDLESICKIPGKKREYLIAESGYYENKLGRIFHIKLKKKRTKAKILGVYNLPKIKPGLKDVEGDNFEGMACFKKDNTFFVVVGERGGSSAYRNSFLRIGILDFDKGALSWKKFIDTPVEISAPGKWKSPNEMRSIADLYIDKDGIIWSVATQDPGDNGPFRSIIFRAAAITDLKTDFPIKALKDRKIYWTIDGLKVESLSGPTELVPDSFISIGSEDENYKGVWRPLFKPLE